MIRNDALGPPARERTTPSALDLYSGCRHLLDLSGSRMVRSLRERGGKINIYATYEVSDRVA